MIYFHTKLHTSGSKYSLLIATEPEAKHRFQAAVMYHHIVP
jgi:hypothetical protein